jgi:hypothetical protein
MRVSIGLGVLAFLCAVPAAAQDKPSAWTHEEDRIAFAHAGISFPSRPGTLAYAETKEFSHPGEGIDTSIRYHTPDKEVFATVYVYLPALSHSGLAAVATEEAIRLNSKPSLKVLGTRKVTVGGVTDAAIRSDFGNYQERFASSAAFVKAGRWMVKVRVSGPESRRAEVESAMSALIEGMRFSGKTRASKAMTIEPSACPELPDKAAGLIPAESGPPGAAALEDGIVGALDPAGDDEIDKGVPAARIGTQWCRTYTKVGDANVPLLHATDGVGREGRAKSMLLALYSDAGSALEIVRHKQRYVLLHHQIGVTTVFGAFDAVPSDAQIGSILAGKGQTGPARVSIRLKPNGDTDIQVQVPEKKPAPTT